MLSDAARERYLRHILLKEVGGQGQQKLLAAHVLVIGAGGIGAPLLQYLAAAGVGTIGVADDDVVALSNLQRQVLYSTDDVGAQKAERAHAAIARLNPDIKVIEHRTKITDANAGELIASYDLVVEGIDNFAGRYAINRAAIALRKPLVSAAVGRFDAQLSVFKPFAGAGLPCYRCLVPEAPPRDAQVNCAEEGVLGAVTGVIGTLAAIETLKEILKLGESLAGRLLLYDGLAAQFRTIALPADPQCPDCSAIARD
ncbi:MAG: molybdopterin-synthase adenylyltransferase MoeB [Parvularculaceae bacterium]|nr:molybdopterin-synthase adenylyltransferase MoeB [Caulobacterales bacterium]